nr:phospholipase D-like domain-containing protein [uncultured Flavobacterium sp.]
MEVFTQNIEQVILEHFDKAKKSIIIVVAWFTNPKIIAKIIELKKFKNLDIQILVDNNEVNQKYFFDLHSSDLKNSGVEIKSQYISKFNHNKFAIIDNEVLITGSYNYTNKANKNFENIIIEIDSRIANFYYRIFNFFTNENYIDPNIEILFENFDFSNKLISTYYPFSSKLFLKLKPKINLGFCFTHENGLYNEISYEPGLIFNPKFRFHKELLNAINNKYSLEYFNSNLSQEFDLPITKELIRDFRISESQNFNYQIVQEIANLDNTKIDYEDFGNLIESNEVALTEYYTRKFKTIYTTQELRNILKKDIDIIIEDYIWINNFAPFLKEAIIENIYKNCR